MNRKTITILLAILAFLFALGLTLYPVISIRYNDRHQSLIHTDFEEVLAQTNATELDRIRSLAMAYNSSLVPGVRDVNAFSLEAIQYAESDYVNQLDISGNGIMGYLQVPKIHVQLPIYHGTADATLEIGVGHLLGSSLPIGGESSHCILSGHSGMASSKMLSDLDRMEIGDVFFLDVLGERLAYEVDQIKTVLPHDTTFLGIEPGKDLATLVTCTPFGVNTHRLLVRGSRIAYTEKVEEAVTLIAEEPVESTWEEQYEEGLLYGMLAVLILLAIVIFFTLYWRHANEAR